MVASGIFFDGLTSARRAVALELGSSALEISSAEDGLAAAWRFADIALHPRRDGILRIGQAGSKVPARLEIRDAAFAAELMGRVTSSDRTGLTDRATRTKVVLWSVAAITSLVACGIWGVPFVAERVAPRLPVAVEMRLGQAVDAQVRRTLEFQAEKPFECGVDKAEATAAFNKLVGTLERAAGLSLPLRVRVVRVAEANAIALPGGRIYLFQGLLAKANSIDEVAGVLAHEIGHVAHRDVTKSVLNAGGMSFLFGMLLGDFTGGGAAVFATRVVLQSANSREAEAQADAFGAALLSKVGGDPRALGLMLQRIAGKTGFPQFLLSHPESRERAAAIEQIPRPAVVTPLLTPQEWAAFKTICSSGPGSAATGPGRRPSSSS